jgi:hypothetical protein
MAPSRSPGHDASRHPRNARTLRADDPLFGSRECGAPNRAAVLRALLSRCRKSCCLGNFQVLLSRKLPQRGVLFDESPPR